MKKTFLTLCFISIFSFSFFSCASKESEPENQLTAPETEVTETDISEEAEETVTVEEENKAEETEVISEEAEEETSSEEPASEFEELPEITEPEVFEAELPPVPVVTVEKDPEVKIVEPVTEDDYSELPELPPEETESQKEPEVVEEVKADEKAEDSKDKTEVEEIDEVIEENNTREDEVEDLEAPGAEAEEKEESGKPEVVVQIVPSRSVSMKKGESLDVVYPGKGWVFLGCTDGSKNLTSTGRKTSDKNTSFTLMARVPGTVILHFYKEDILGDQYIDDYLEVKVSELKSKPSVHVKAPDYAEVVPKKPAPKVSKPAETKAPEPNSEVAEEPKYEEIKPEETKVEEKLPPKTSEVKRVQPKAEETKPVAATEEPRSYKVLSGDEYMTAARKAIDEKNFTEVYNNLQNFLTVSESGRDEALFLLAQLYEGNSEYRNIKKSVETYEELIQNYPLSDHYEEAEKRAIYLKRFYINIR